jgi:hypothetical protein
VDDDEADAGPCVIRIMFPVVCNPARCLERIDSTPCLALVSNMLSIPE